MADVSKFFDRIYYETYRQYEPEERNEAEARFIVEALELSPPAKVLDVGCGYGRHAVYLARHGFDVLCIDNSEYLLGKAIERIREFGVEDRVDIIKADMRWLGLPAEYDAAYMFYTTFGYYSDEENLSILRGIASALRPGGRILIDVWNPYRIVNRVYSRGGVERYWHEAGGYTVLEENVIKPDEPVLHLTRNFLDETGRLVEVKSIDVRIYFPWEYRAMFERVRLELSRIYGDYRRGEFRFDSPRMVVIGVKKG